MTQTQIVINLINWGVNAAFVIAFLFPAAVRTFWAWEKSDWGINIVSLEFAIALALLPAWLHRTVGLTVNTLLFEWTDAIAIWSIPGIIIWRMIIIWRSQRYNEKE
jgi:hypothetical protein